MLIDFFIFKNLRRTANNLVNNQKDPKNNPSESITFMAMLIIIVIILVGLFLMYMNLHMIYKTFQCLPKYTNFFHIAGEIIILFSAGFFKWIYYFITGKYCIFEKIK